MAGLLGLVAGLQGVKPGHKEALARIRAEVNRAR